jgi:hypothetical protein
MNNLTNRLSAMADEMSDTDYTALRNRVGATSRRLGHRRAVGTSLAALVVVGAASIGGLQLAPRDYHLPITAGTPSAQITPDGTPSPPATPAPSAPPATTAPGSPAVSAPRHVPGQLVYLRVGAEIEVITVTDGVTRIINFGHRQPDDGVASVAPDGSKVALIRSTKPISPYPGDLVIVSPGGVRKVLQHNVSWGGGNEPVWTPDSRRLMIGVTTLTGDVATGQSVGYVDVATGKYDKLTADAFPMYLSWSANGAYRVHASSSDTLVVSRSNGDVVRRVSLLGQPECTLTSACPFGVQAISNDGRYVATGLGNSDPTRVNQAGFVLDTVTGKRIGLPSVVKDVTEIFFQPDDGLIVQTTNRLYLIDLDGTIAGTITRPFQNTGHPSPDL